MAKRKATTDTDTPTTPRSPISRERRLALALRAMLENTGGEGTSTELNDAAMAAEALLSELGYGALESTGKRLARINAELAEALKFGDGAAIARLGLELERVKAGRTVKEQ